MRHLGSVVLAVTVAPLVLFLAGRGLTGFTEAASAERTDQLAVGVAFAALGLAGLLYAGLTLPRFSPLGPGLAGAAYVAFGVLIMLGPADPLDRLPAEALRPDGAQVRAAAAVAPLLALPLLLTVFSAGRWRGRDTGEPTTPGYHSAEPALADTQEMPTVPLY